MTLTENEILDSLRALGQKNEFAASLVKQHHKPWSFKQRFWAEKLASEYITKQNVPIVNTIPIPDANLSNIVEMFSHAEMSGLKRLRVKFRLPNGSEVQIGKSKLGGLYVYRYGRGNYGNVATNGDLTCNKRYTSDDSNVILEHLKEFNQNPAEFASRTGRLMGSCCFCALTLTDERSLSVGYGPICAKHWKLPWG